MSSQNYETLSWHLFFCSGLLSGCQGCGRLQAEKSALEEEKKQLEEEKKKLEQEKARLERELRLVKDELHQVHQAEKAPHAAAKLFTKQQVTTGVIKLCWLLKMDELILYP